VNAIQNKACDLNNRGLFLFVIDAIENRRLHYLAN
jgi:hypothetical protein